MFQHDVGFSAYFNSKQPDDNKSECIEVSLRECRNLFSYVVTNMLYHLLDIIVICLQLQKMEFGQGLGIILIRTLISTIMVSKLTVQENCPN